MTDRPGRGMKMGELEWMGSSPSHWPQPSLLFCLSFLWEIRIWYFIAIFWRCFGHNCHPLSTSDWRVERFLDLESKNKLRVTDCQSAEFWIFYSPNQEPIQLSKMGQRPTPESKIIIRPKMVTVMGVVAEKIFLFVSTVTLLPNSNDMHGLSGAKIIEAILRLLQNHPSWYRWHLGILRCQQPAAVFLPESPPFHFLIIWSYNDLIDRSIIHYPRNGSNDWLRNWWNHTVMIVVTNL